MRHPADATGDKRRCPITSELFDEAWTDHSLPGCYNRCKSCSPEQYKPLAERLQELKRKRERKL